MRTTISTGRHNSFTGSASLKIAHSEELNLVPVDARDFSEGPVTHHLRWFILIVLNVFQSIKFVDDWMFRNACSGLFSVAVNEPFCTHKIYLL